MAYNTGNAIGSTDARDLYDNAQNLDKAMNSTDPTWTDRFGVARPTFKGAESELNQKVSDAEAAATQALGYLNTMRATSYGPLAEDPTTDPLGNPCTAGDEYFNTTYNLLKRFDGSIWRVPDINTENLASGAGSSMVGHGGQTVESALNERMPEIGTYALLRAYNGPVTAFLVRGVENTFDGGAGVFRVKSGDTTSADNGGTILVDAIGRRWFREFSWSFNVRWFGAVGDGVADDTAAIQAALNNGGHILLLGKFRVTSTLNITKGGTLLIGRGWASIIGSTSVQAGSDQIIWEGTGSLFNIAPYVVSDIERIRLEGFAITGNGTNDGVYADNCRHSEFDNVYITNVRDCWYFNDTCWQNKMARCQGMSFSRYGIYANSGTEDSVLDTCVFRGYGSASVGLYVNYYASTLTAVNCDFSDNKTNVVLNLGLSSVDGVFKFQGCQFEGGTGGGSANHVGIQLVSSSEGTVAIFEGCRWTHTDAANRSSAKAILAGAAKSIVVRGGRVTNIGTFIDIPTAANIGRLEVKDVIGSGVTTVFANQANSVTNRVINNVLSEANNDSIYSEGTFQPVIVGTSTSGTGTYTTQLGFWRRVGNVVYFNLQCTWTAHTGTGNIQINGLPFLAAAIGTAQPVSVFMSDIALSANNVMQCFIGSGVNSVAVRQVPIGGGSSAVVPMDTAGTLSVSGTYFV